MSMNEIMDVIIDLSHSQGFWGRLYRQIMELDEDSYNKLKEYLENQNFTDTLDCVLFLENM